MATDTRTTAAATEPISEPVPEAVSQSVSEQPPLPQIESGNPVVPLPEPYEPAVVPAGDQKADINTVSTADTEKSVNAEGTGSGTLQQNGSALNGQNQEIRGTVISAREEMECETDVIGDATTSDSNTNNTMDTTAADTVIAKGDASVVDVNGDGNAGVVLTVKDEVPTDEVPADEMHSNVDSEAEQDRTDKIAGTEGMLQDDLHCSSQLAISRKS